MSHSGINEKLEKDKSDDEDDEQHGFNKKRTRKESPISIKNNEKGSSSSSSSKKRSHSSSEKKRSHNADIADKDLNWNELELNSEIGSDHATEEVQQRTTTRKRKVNISEMFKPRKIECIRPGRGQGARFNRGGGSPRHAVYTDDISKKTVRAMVESGDLAHISDKFAYYHTSKHGPQTLSILDGKADDETSSTSGAVCDNHVEIVGSETSQSTSGVVSDIHTVEVGDETSSNTSGIIDKALQEKLI